MFNNQYITYIEHVSCSIVNDCIVQKQFNSFYAELNRTQSDHYCSFEWNYYHPVGPDQGVIYIQDEVSFYRKLRVIQHLHITDSLLS